MKDVGRVRMGFARAARSEARSAARALDFFSFVAMRSLRMRTRGPVRTGEVVEKRRTQSCGRVLRERDDNACVRLRGGGGMSILSLVDFSMLEWSIRLSIGRHMSVSTSHLTPVLNPAVKQLTSGS